MNPLPTGNPEGSASCPQCGFQPVAGKLSRSLRSKAEARVQPSGDWVPLLEAAACEVFEIMLGTRLERPVAEQPPPVTGLTAMIGLAGLLCGILSIRCESDCATRMAATMLGPEANGQDDNLCDALGEICNMVAGTFKAKVAGLEDGCALSVPSVIRGADYHLYPLTHGERLEVCLSFNGAPLWVDSLLVFKGK